VNAGTARCAEAEPRGRTVDTIGNVEGPRAEWREAPPGSGLSLSLLSQLQKQRDSEEDPERMHDPLSGVRLAVWHSPPCRPPLGKPTMKR